MSTSESSHSLTSSPSPVHGLSSATGNSVSSSSVNNNREPDPNAIKMFVGQIPRDWSELECRSLFEQFGEIYSLNVLKDKSTGLSKGCCFVTFYSRKSALDAQNALHNIKTLSGMHHPIQMKPADSENRNERKLFIGMLSKGYNESDVELMFAPYGIIEDCTVLRDVKGNSKGCAFVTFVARQCALNAIKAMNQSQTMEGCTSPLVVKFADTQKDKDARRQQQIIMQHLAAAAVAHQQPNPAAALATANPYLALAAAAAATAQQQHVQQHQLAAATLALQQQLAASMPSGADQLTLAAAAAAALVNNPLIVASLCAGVGTNGTPTGTTATQQQTHLNGTGDLYAAATNQTQQAHHTFSNMAGLGSATPTAAQLAQLIAASNQSQNNNFASIHPNNHSSAVKQTEGPEGANLFIYHLPAEFSDSDLAQTFSPFGNVLSSKVFIDKQTKLSKCFGFVSYDNPISAQAAIQAMNGFQVGPKRLKVQLKRNKEKPY